MQHGGFGRHLDIGHIGVPHGLPVAEISDRFAVFDDVGNDVELRMLLVERLSVRVRPRRIELSEVLTERDELRVRELLPMEHDHQPFTPYIFLC
jgi:hypothetical protein